MCSVYAIGLCLRISAKTWTATAFVSKVHYGKCAVS